MQEAGVTREAYIDLAPVTPYGAATEVAHAAAFLASADSDYINGHIVNVGGRFRAAGQMIPLPMSTSMEMPQ
jgi:NAD(P)-dependent dehydrogenase (short-subunit alcohol dehydrogenase family)